MVIMMPIELDRFKLTHLILRSALLSLLEGCARLEGWPQA